MQFIFVAGDCYCMGDILGDRYVDVLVHEVCIEDFCIWQYEVTQGEHNGIAVTNPSY